MASNIHEKLSNKNFWMEIKQINLQRKTLLVGVIWGGGWMVFLWRHAPPVKIKIKYNSKPKKQIFKQISFTWQDKSKVERFFEANLWMMIWLTKLRHYFNGNLFQSEKDSAKTVQSILNHNALDTKKYWHTLSK